MKSENTLDPKSETILFTNDKCPYFLRNPLRLFDHLLDRASKLEILIFWNITMIHKVSHCHRKHVNIYHKNKEVNYH